MKKLLLSATLCVAVLVSAETLDSKNENAKKNEKILIKKSLKNKKVVNDCTPVTASCGATGWYCDDNKTIEGFFRMAEALEAIYCEN